MNIANRLPSAANPRWDGARILFQIEIAGQLVSCAISRAALQELRREQPITSGDLLRQFAAVRGAISTIATNMFAGTFGDGRGTLHISVGDIHDPPSSPVVALQAARRAACVETHHPARLTSVAA